VHKENKEIFEQGGRVLVGKVGSAGCPTGRLTHRQAVPESHTRRASAKVHDAVPPTKKKKKIFEQDKNSATAFPKELTPASENDSVV